VIALRIALACAENRADGILFRGLDISWVRDECVALWQLGFKDDTSIEAMRTILDEMIGLGVLRKVDEQRYTLRSPNLLNLLGTRDEIEVAFWDATQQEPKGQYEAAKFHRTLTGDDNRRSPLTAQQESELLAPASGVSILYGTGAAGLAELEQALKEACGDTTFLQVLTNIADREEFKRSLERLGQEREKRAEGLFLLAVARRSDARAAR
jgi:hypothetical protein